MDRIFKSALPERKKGKLVSKPIYLLKLPDWRAVAYEDLGLAYSMAETFIRADMLDPAKSLMEVAAELSVVKISTIYGLYHGKLVPLYDPVQITLLDLLVFVEAKDEKG